MKKLLLLSALFLFIFYSGCTKSVRYSQEEIADFPPSIQENIRHGEIVVGMTKLQVRYAWGGPESVHVLPSTEDGKERVRWEYKKLRFFKTHLFFTDDKLTEIISTEPGISK